MRSARGSIVIVKLPLRNICSFVTGCQEQGTQAFVPHFVCIWILSASQGSILIVLLWIIWSRIVPWIFIRLLSVDCLDHIETPAGPSNYARTGDVPAHYLGQSGVDDGAGLSQGNANAPSTYMLLAGYVAFVLADRPDCGSGDEVVRYPLVGLLFHPRGGSESGVDGGAESDAGIFGREELLDCMDRAVY